MGISNPTQFLISQGAGAVGSAFSAAGVASGQKSALNSSAAIADINAHLADVQSQAELASGAREEQKVLMTGAQVKSSQRAAMAANGIDLGSPTAVNVLDSTDTMKEIDANTVAANAARSAWGYKFQQVQYESQARSDRATAKGISPIMAAGTSLLTSAKQIGTTRYLLQKSGAWDEKQVYGPQQQNWFQRNLNF